MAKLYPPYIEGTIPAFTGGELIVPFSMNRAVSRNEIGGFIVKIKTVQNNYYITSKDAYAYDLSKMEAYFKFTEEELKTMRVGQFYKIQMAYKDKNNETGYYSTVGVVKYTTAPNVIIEGLKTDRINNHEHGYMGVYSQQNGDATEKIYSSRFIVFNANNDIMIDSGEIIHNSIEDNYSYMSNEYFEIPEDLEKGQTYSIQYIATTVNGMVCKSSKYRIMQRESIQPEIDAHLEVSLNFEEGYIDVDLVGHLNEEDVEVPVVGAFLLTRANVKTPNKWEVLHRFSLQSELPTKKIFRDCTIEQGESYIYSLQQYNDYGLYSNRILSEKIRSDFEHAFLYDGKRQLKIKYNPKVSSFKNNIPETKIDTIGSQHPFIFRNGKVKYKDFPISGLISYYMDEAEMFMNEEDYSLQEKTTNLIGENQIAERLFKLEVLDWLSNGEPKLFRSPGEGNYLVRIMNPSLSPIDTLGRMLHSFNCNAYEVANFNYDEMVKYGILQVAELDNERTRWATRELVSRNEFGGLDYLTGELLTNPKDSKQSYVATSAEFRDMYPGTQVIVNGQTIVIGATGSYSITGQEITSIQIPESSVGSVTFSYKAQYENTFGLIKDIEIKEVPAKQIIGAQWGEKQEYDKFDGEYKTVKVNVNALEPLEDIKTNILKFIGLYFEKRPIDNLYIKNIQTYTSITPEEWDYSISGNPIIDIDNTVELYFDRECTQRASSDALYPFALYAIRNADISYSREQNLNEGQEPEAPNYYKNEYYYIDRQMDKFYPVIGSLLDGNSLELIPIPEKGKDPENYEYSTIFYYNLGEKYIPISSKLSEKYYGIDLNEIEHYELHNVKDANDIILTNGVMMTASYQAQNLIYLLEEENEEVVLAKQKYLDAVADWEENRAALNETSNDEDIKNSEKLRKEIDKEYNNFISVLEKAIIEYKEAHAIPYEESVVR